MRLTKYVAQTSRLTRSQAKIAIRKKRVLVDDVPVTDPAYQLTLSKSSTQVVKLDGQSLNIQAPFYLLLFKPQGFICSTVNEEHPSALNLLIEEGLIGTMKGLERFDPLASELHFAGRLDVDTTGLVLISNDGQWTHKVTSPRKSCSKTYHVWLAESISLLEIKSLCEGVVLKGESKPTKPCVITKISDKEVTIELLEGRYHQVKRMFASVGNKVIKLHRESIGDIDLSGLNEKEWRKLSVEEIAQF